MKRIKNLNILQMFVAGILCFVAVYLSEPTLGAVATFPFIIILPSLAYVIYRKALHITGLCALAGIIFKCAFVSDIPSALIFALTVALYSAFAVFAVKLIITLKSKKSILVSCAIFAVLLVAYIIFNGTLLGNLDAKKRNIQYVESTYPEEIFTVGSTYFRVADFCYVTEFIFTDAEVYSAKISADKDGGAKINGYEDYSCARLLSYGVERLRGYLSNYGYEGQDFAVRPDKIETDTLLVAGLSPEDYYDKMCYEIAFYYEFPDEDGFADMCEKYIVYIPEVFDYHSITFYGFGEKDDFEYSLTHRNGSTDYTVTPFDKKNFKSYTEDMTKQKYWEMIK